MYLFGKKSTYRAKNEEKQKAKNYKKKRIMNLKRIIRLSDKLWYRFQMIAYHCMRNLSKTLSKVKQSLTARRAWTKNFSRSEKVSSYCIFTIWSQCCLSKK